MKKILIIDIETTGFLNAGGKIIEIGIVELDLQDGSRKMLVDELVYEDGLTYHDMGKAWIVSNSDIKPMDVMQAQNLKSVQASIQQVINDYPLGATAFNNTFDFGFMEDRGFSFPVKLACPMKLSTDICKLKGRYPGKYKWPKVQEAYDFFFGKTDYVEKHRGADDAMHEAKIIYELYKRGIFKLNKEV